ncbi:MAG: iron-sulfur cluster assembly accessory protein, partial [Bdellovibrionota bacterium]
MIKITESAAAKIQVLKVEDKAPTEAFLRVKVKRGGCSGYSYKMEFDTALGEKDKLFEMNAAKVVVDDQSMLYLLGLTLDFEGGLNGKGFV